MPSQIGNNVLKCLVFTFAVNACVASDVSTSSEISRNMSAKTMYFAFGSNLLTSRMHVMNPTAVRAGIGKLQDYQLDFVSYSKVWQGFAATVVPKEGSHVWGALWEIPTENIPELDKQEGVQANIYYPITVDVQMPDGKTIQARCYRQVGEVLEVNLQNLPDQRKPTPAYLNTMIEGAVESGLPTDYIEYMKKIPHNGSTVKPNLNFVYPKV
ncbi:unnamed protein product [Psylliodes chrysocephalus]|uniref:gamma-glutamylcyclotransferase n=1 Tax=Psylliodes chrysocephalus TaxID=3402493 RepID=A0A9P0D6K8_9CUCU|nr:unnamed protein product [Psylliodes chrysocephala]